MINKIKNDELLKKIISFSPDTNIYLVGGCIRDFILNKENHDKDIIAACSDVEQYARSLADNLEATFITLDEENKIYRLVLKDKTNYIDIAAVIGKNIQEDLKRRDFTINSVAVNLHSMEILDINNGLNDLKNKIIRGISDKNFSDDPLRLLRAYRFHANLGFDIDEHLQTILNKNFQTLKNVAVERINAELLKLFEGEFTHKTLALMDKNLEYFFPIVKEVKKIPPNSHHHLPLFEHSIETMRQVQMFYNKSNDIIKTHLKPRLGLLKLGAFLHDIGKPQTWTIEEDTGRHRFIKHDDVGSKIVVPTLKSLNFSKKQIAYTAALIKNHIYPSQVISSHGDLKKTFMRYIRKTDDMAIDIIAVAMADRLSARGKEITEEIVKQNIDGLTKLLNFYLEIKDSLEPLPVLLDGNEIMAKFGIKPSPQLGKIISALKEAQISGEVNTKTEAKNFVEEFLKKV